MADETALEQPKKKKGLIKWIIILVLILGIAAAAFFFKDTIMSLIGMGDATQQEEPEDKPMQPAAGFKGEMSSVEPFVANLNDPLGKRYIKLGLEVELINEQAVQEFAESQIKIKNMLLILLGSKKPQEMLGPKNQLQLQQEIVERINQLIGEGKVLQVYFSIYILQ